MSGNEKNPSKTSDITSFLSGKSGNLQKLYHHARKLIEIREYLKSVVPFPINNHITVANLYDNTLIINADSAAWAARLRFYTPEILKALNDNNICTSVKSIRIKVMPPDNVQHDHTEEKLSISADTAALLQHVAESIVDPDLRETLLKLSRNR